MTARWPYDVRHSAQQIDQASSVCSARQPACPGTSQERPKAMRRPLLPTPPVTRLDRACPGHFSASPDGIAGAIDDRVDKALRLVFAFGIQWREEHFSPLPNEGVLTDTPDNHQRCQHGERGCQGEADILS